MIGSTRAVRVFAYSSPADMRKGFDGLYGLVADHLKHDPLSGDLFLFVSGNRKRAKVLLWDGTGLCLYAKRLEKGRFARVWGDTSAELTMAELHLFLEGSQLVGKVRVSPAKLCLRCLTQAVETATIPHAESGGDPRPRDPPPDRHPS
ncbi:MAG: IS66 family insertion sequence element accessory protein TnpB [Thermoanaerobaculaceae bacterium]|jgi:transposase|nr:IS66 family insertion sequence element accessory protein TnpB [Thermoanaerobaculaceae bacterium]